MATIVRDVSPVHVLNPHAIDYATAQVPTCQSIRIPVGYSGRLLEATESYRYVRRMWTGIELLGLPVTEDAQVATNEIWLLTAANTIIVRGVVY